MNTFFRYIAAGAILVTSLVGCEDSYDENLEQQEEIVDYLESTHSPNLINVTEVANSIDLDPPFYTVYGNYAYRYISTYYDAGRESMPEVKSGSTITILFDLYSFTGSDIDTSSDLPLLSNKSEDETKLLDAGLNTELWDFTPLTIVVGRGDLLSAIETALVGCRQEDEVFVYMTRDEAYGSNIIGLAEKETMLRFSCTIEIVE